MDIKAGTIHMPIGRAMDLVIQDQKDEQKADQDQQQKEEQKVIAALFLPSRPRRPLPAQPLAAPDAQPLAAQDAPVDVVERLGERVANATFMDTEGNRVELRDLTARGKPVVLTLIYFDCPMLCSLVLKGVIKALNQSGLRLRDDYYGLTVSFSPPTPFPRRACARRYMQTLAGAAKARPVDWPFLAGGVTPSARSPTASASATATTRIRTIRAPRRFHGAHARRNISRYLYGVDFPGRDLRLAVLEAAQGRVGATLDRIILRCFKYDPASRKYHFYVMGALRLGSGFCAVALAGLLGVLWWREKKGKGKAA